MAINMKGTKRWEERESSVMWPPEKFMQLSRGGAAGLISNGPEPNTEDWQRTNASAGVPVCISALTGKQTSEGGTFSKLPPPPLSLHANFPPKPRKASAQKLAALATDPSLNKNF